MFNRRIQHTKPYIPHSFGKKPKKRRRHDYGAIGEALFILVCVGVFLWLCFGGVAL